MASTVLEEFLVKLGFQVDPAQHNRFQDAMKESQSRIETFNKSLIGVVDRFANLATLASGAGVGLAAAMNKIGEHLSGLAFAAERIGSTPEKITAFENAMKMLGGTAEGARASLENIARAERTTPGLLQALFGVKPGTDPVDAMRQIGQHFAELIRRGPAGMAQAIQEAQLANIDQAEMLRLANQNMNKFYEESRDRVRRWGADMDQAGRIAQDQQRNITRLQEHWQGFTTYLYQTFGPEYVGALGVINGWFDTNAPKVKSHVDSLKRDFDGLVGGLADAFKALTPGQQAGVEIGGAVAGGAIAARVGGSILGRLGGMVGLGGLGKLGSLGIFGVVLGGLINDFETWKKDRNESFINWDQWAPGIEAATKALSHLNDDIIGPMADKLGVPRTFIPAFEALALYLGGPFIKSILGGGLGRLVRILALIPGSGISAAMLTGLGIVGGVAAGLEVGKNAIGSEESEKAIMEGRNLPDLGQEAKMSPEDASRRVQEDLSRAREQGGGGGSFVSRMMSKLGLGGKLDPGTAHSADEIKQYMMAKGWSEAQAAGIAANAIAESGGKPRIVNESGHAGLFQWDQNRQQTFARMFGHTMTDQQVSAEQLFREELDFADWELSHTEKKAGDKLRGETTPQGAAISMGQNYERYASGPSPEDTHRANLAGQIARPGVMPAGFTTPTDMTPAAAPAAPTPVQQVSMSTDQSRAVQLTDNSQVTINGISDPQRAARLVDNSKDRRNANLARHLGVTYA